MPVLLCPQGSGLIFSAVHDAAAAYSQAAPLAPLLRRAMDAGRVGASLYTGRWTDVGTPQRWAELQQ